MNPSRLRSALILSAFDMPLPNISVHVTHVGTATALIEIDDLVILTDPYFSPENTVWTGASGAKLINSYQPALQPKDLPPIDLVLLSHENHKDNLDDIGRELLNGRRVITTSDGAEKLAPRKGVRGLKPWESTTVQIGNGSKYVITATPCEHLPPGECIGFLITAEHFGESHGKPNAVYLSGDTIYIKELARIREHASVALALFNLGKATVPNPNGQGLLQITMDGNQAVQLLHDTEAEVVIPMHFEGWNHFKEGKEALQKVFREAGVDNRFKILGPGIREKVM